MEAGRVEAANTVTAGAGLDAAAGLDPNMGATDAGVDFEDAGVMTGDGKDSPTGHQGPPSKTGHHYDETHPKPKPKPLKPTWSASSSHLRSMDELVGKCFGFPISNFNHNNNIQSKYPNDPTHFFDNSDSAVDFKLATLDGQKVVLSELLKEKPVVLIYGMYTCPAFQGFYSEQNPTSHMSKFDEYALVEKYAEQVTFLHLYGPEPHPKRPDKNFDTGKIIEFPWSTVRNAKTWTARREATEMIQDDIHPEQLLLMDNLGGPTMLDHGMEEPPYNPVWCSYGPGARQAFLIGRSGRIYDVQAWFHASTMAGAIEELMLLEKGLVNSTDLEEFRQMRTDQHAAVENDIASAIESAFVIQGDKSEVGEAEVGATEKYDVDRRDPQAEVTKARVILDQYTSNFIKEIYEAQGLEAPDAEVNYGSTHLAPKLDAQAAAGSTLSEGGFASAGLVAGLVVGLVAVGAVVRRWHQSRPDSYHSVASEEI